MGLSSVLNRFAAESPALLPVFLDAAMKGGAILALTALVVLAMRRASAAARHLVWFLGTLSLLTLPVLSIALPGWHILPHWAPVAVVQVSEPAAMPLVTSPLPADSPPALSTSPMGVGPLSPGERAGVRAAVSTGITPDVTPAPIRRPWQSWALLAWLTGSLALLAYVALGFLSLCWLRHRSAPIAQGPWPIILGQLREQLGSRRPVELLSSPRRTMPMTWGLWRTRILLPEDCVTWSPEQCRAVLLHERAHAKRWDCLTQLGTQITCALHWFNPLVWVAWRRMQTERERACDDLVLTTGTKASAYAEHLLHIAAEMPAVRFSAAAIAMARPSKLEGRLLAILDTKRNRRSLTRRGVLAAVMLIVGVVLPLSLIKAKAADKTEPSAIPPAASQPVSVPATDVAAAKAPGEDAAHHLIVTGLVVDEKGRGVAGATVQVLELPQGLTVAVKPAITALDGRFALDVGKDNPHSQYLRARLQDSRQGFLDRQVNGQYLHDVKITLKPAREFAVTVKTDKGSAVPGATVGATTSYQLVSDQYETNDQGQATLRVPADAPLQYVFAVKEHVGLDYFAFVPSQMLHSDPYHLAQDYRGPLAFVLNGVSVVTVIVEDQAHEKLDDAAVYPWYIDKPRKGEDFNLSGLNLFYRHATNGRVEFAMIPADDSTVVNFWVRREGYTSQQRWLWDPKSGKKEITATLVKQVPLSGRVVGQDGRPIAGATVRVDGAGYALDNFRGEAESKADGTFALDVDPEQYYVLVAQKGHDISPPVTQIIHNQAPGKPLQLRLAPGIRVHGKATAGPDNQPAANAYVALIYNDESYNGLPASEQLAGKTGNGKPISPHGIQRGYADKQGEFEFYSFPGKLQLIGSFGWSGDRQNFTLDNVEQEVAIHFESASPQPAMVHGRVVREDDPEVGVAEAVLHGQRMGARDSFIEPEATADRDGNFQIRQAATDLCVYALSPDKELAALTLIKPDEDDVTISLSPAASAKGRLLDKNGKPLAGQTFRCFVNAELDNGLNIDIIYGTLTTKSDGTYVVAGLIPGHNHVLSIQRHDDPFSPTFELGMVKPKAAETVDLGDKTLGTNAPPDP